MLTNDSEETTASIPSAEMNMEAEVSSENSGNYLQNYTVSYAKAPQP
jgi:hypothetical protein